MNLAEPFLGGESALIGCARAQRYTFLKKHDSRAAFLRSTALDQEANRILPRPRVKLPMLPSEDMGLRFHHCAASSISLPICRPSCRNSVYGAMCLERGRDKSREGVLHLLRATKSGKSSVMFAIIPLISFQTLRCDSYRRWPCRHRSKCRCRSRRRTNGTHHSVLVKPGGLLL